MYANVAGASVEVPRTGLRAVCRDVAAAGLAAETALHAARRDVSRTRVQVDIARTAFGYLNVAAAGAAMDRARNRTRSYIAGTGLDMNVSREVREIDIT